MHTEEQARTKWCPVVGFEGYLEVSTDGRLRSIPRMFTRGDGFVRVRGSELKGKMQNGYRRVCLSFGGGQLLRFVHVLVAETFIGPRPSPKHQVNHKDGNRTNNDVGNLEWVTPSENQLHSWRVLGRAVTEKMRASAPKGEANGRSKITNADAERIRARRISGEPCAVIAKDFGLHPSQISRISRSLSHCGLAGEP